MLLPAVLDVCVGDRSPSGGAALVSVRYRSRISRVAEVACWLALAGWVVFIGVVVGDDVLRESYDPGLVQVAVIAVVATIVVLRSRARRLFLTDPILGAAAATAATALGHDRGAGRRRLRGAVVGRIGSDLVRLHRLWTPETHGPGRQQALLQQAHPELRRFMQPTLRWSPTVDRFDEPDDLDAAPYQPGDAWPALDHHSSNSSVPPSPSHDRL